VGNDRESAADSLNVIGCFYYAMPFRQSKARCDARLYIKRKQSYVVGLIVRLARALVRWGEEGGGSASLSSSDLVAWCRLTVRHECEDKQSFRANSWLLLLLWLRLPSHETMQGLPSGRSSDNSTCTAEWILRLKMAQLLVLYREQALCGKSTRSVQPCSAVMCIPIHHCC